MALFNYSIQYFKSYLLFLFREKKIKKNIYICITKALQEYVGDLTCCIAKGISYDRSRFNRHQGTGYLTG